MAVRAATSQELAKFRADGQASKLYLAIRKPSTVYTAQLAAPLPASTDMQGQINYASGSGTLANVLSGMTLLVGTTLGGRDLGLARIRKAPTASIFYITEISEINWLAGGVIYLTVVDEFTLWAKPVKLISQVPYMDFDVVYSDQHTNFDPVILMGPDVVLWRNASTVSFAWSSAAGSYDPSGAASIASYLWSAPGASATSGMNTAAPSFTYNADGQFKVYCAITLTNGKSFTACRTVFVYSSAHMPETNFKLESSPRFVYDNGGWKFEITLDANADLAAVQDRAKVILFARDFYQGVEGSIGPVAGRENIVCCGWIDGETIEWDSEKSTVRCTVSGAQEWFKKIPAFALGLENTAAPSNAWTNIRQLTPRLMLWHLLHWRSTASAIMDIDMTADTRQMRSLDMQQASLWAQMAACAHDQILADPIVDRYGSLYIHIRLQYVPVASRSAFPVIMSLAKGDYAGTLTITRRVVDAAARVELSGVSIQTSAEDKAIFSLSPGHVFKHYGESVNQDYLLLADQAQANTLAGAVLAYQNRPLDFEFELSMNNRLIDGAPRAYLAIAIAANDTLRGIAYSGNVVPVEIELAQDEHGGCKVRIHAEQETFPDIAVDGDIPYYPDLPPLPPLPKIPPLPAPAPLPVVVPASFGYAITYMPGSGFWYTRNWSSAYPNWFHMTDGLDFAHYSSMRGLQITSTGILLSLYFDPNVSGGRMWYATSLGGTWMQSLIPDAATLIDNPDSYPFPRAYCEDGFGVNPLASDSLVLLGSGVYTITSTRVGYSFLGSHNAVSRTSPGGGYIPSLNFAGADRRAYLKMGADGYYLLAYMAGNGPVVGAAARLDASGVGAHILPFSNLGNVQSPVLNQTTVPINAVVARSGPPYLSRDNGLSWRQMSGGPTPYDLNIDTEACAANADGSKVMVGVNVADGLLGLRTCSNGVSWTSNPNIPNKVSCVEYLGKDPAAATETWAVCQLGSIKTTSDFGASFQDKTGDLAAQAGPAFVVGNLRVF